LFYGVKVKFIQYNPVTFKKSWDNTDINGIPVTAGKSNTAKKTRFLRFSLRDIFDSVPFFGGKIKNLTVFQASYELVAYSNH